MKLITKEKVLKNKGSEMAEKIRLLRAICKKTNETKAVYLLNTTTKKLQKVFGENSRDPDMVGTYYVNKNQNTDVGNMVVDPQFKYLDKYYYQVYTETR